MSSTISQAIQGAGIGGAPTEQKVDQQANIRGLFMLLHGYYGSLLLSRYATGELDASGKDKGTKSAMHVWGAELSQFDSDIVRAAADRCKLHHPKFPPTLPEFAALCRAIQPRRRSIDRVAGIGMSGELRSRQSAQVRAVTMAAYKARLASESGAVEVPGGLAGLHQLIARAVALAGGEEARQLRKLEAP